MRKVLMLLFFSIGLFLLGYVATEMISMQTGETKAMNEAKEIINERIVKEGGGTEPIPILNGQEPLTTIDGEREFNEEQLATYLFNRPDLLGPVGENNADSSDSAIYDDEVDATNLLPGAQGGGAGSAGSQSGSPSYNMGNILEYYQNAAQNVDFNALQQQQYGTYRVGQSIGVLYIPRLNRSIPIIYGTSENDLRYGVGFHRSTRLPGQKNQIVLAGHRDTVFRDFGKLRIGDEFHVKMATGTYIYTIFASQIVDWDDPTVIQSTYPNEVLTVSTCYPFSYLGPAPERYVLYAK